MAGATGPPSDDLPCNQFVELVTDYLEGALDDERRHLVEGHLEICSGCRTVLAQWHEILVLTGYLDEHDIDDLDPAVRHELVTAFCRAYPAAP